MYVISMKSPVNNCAIFSKQANDQKNIMNIVKKQVKMEQQLQKLYNNGYYKRILLLFRKSRNFNPLKLFATMRARTSYTMATRQNITKAAGGKCCHYKFIYDDESLHLF